MMVGTVWAVGLVGCALVLACRAPAVAPVSAAQPLDWNAGDSARVRWLEANGRRMSSGSVELVAPPDEMTDAWQAALLDSLDRGVFALRRLIGSHAWQRLGDRPLRYYLVPERMISHASGNGAVFVSMHRVRGGDAPYLHEAGHELLAPPRPFYYDEYPDTVRAEAWFQAAPYWLIEGLPDLLAQHAASAAGTREGDVFRIGTLAQTDSTCAARLAASPYRADLLRAIGGKGAVNALFTTDRARAAPAFYACARSMSMFVVETIGMERTVALFPAIKRGEWENELQRSTSMSTSALRVRWQERLGY
jgi:hypothetical protein